MDLATKGGIPWFLRAINHSWFNPDNHTHCRDRWALFLDPYRRIVMKNHDGPDYVDNLKLDFLRGGSPAVMSHAGVVHVLKRFQWVCGLRDSNADDRVLTLMADRTFTSPTAPAGIHFAGAIGLSPSTAFVTQWDLHGPSQSQVSV
jgi:hypothetical protein